MGMDLYDLSRMSRSLHEHGSVLNDKEIRSDNAASVPCWRIAAVTPFVKKSE